MSDAEDPFIGMHYYVAGYVRRDGIAPSPFDKPTTFTNVMKERPSEARFAVAQAVMLRRNPDRRASSPLYLTDDAPSGPFVVWDLHDNELVKGQRTNGSGLTMPPPPLWMLPTEDAALMKAVSFYDHHP